MAQQRTPPELNDDAIGEVLLRIPPDSSAYLVGASKVCKLWRRIIISDPDFTRRYRELHPTPPLLGFFHDTDHGYHFFPTMAACPFPRSPPDCNHWWRSLDCCPHRPLKACDCRHGRVLLRDARTFLVWDPITDVREELHKPHIPGSTLSYAAAMVLCAAAGCDHSGCHGGPFLVVFVGGDRRSVHGCVYSSESRSWGTPVSLHLGRGYTMESMDSKRGALAGDDAFFTLNSGDMILKYDLGKNCLSAIDTVVGHGWKSLVMPMDDGSLGLASIKFSHLCLWSRKVNPKGFAEWVQCRVIRFDKLLPITTSCFRACVIGFAEGVGVMFVRTESVDTEPSTFMIELKSGRVRKVKEFGHYFENVLPASTLQVLLTVHYHCRWRKLTTPRMKSS